MWRHLPRATAPVRAAARATRSTCLSAPSVARLSLAACAAQSSARSLHTSIGNAAEAIHEASRPSSHHAGTTSMRAHGSHIVGREGFAMTQQGGWHSVTAGQSNSASAAAITTRPPLDWPVGHVAAGGFTVVRRSEVEEFNLTVFELVHPESGAQFMHVSRADSDNAFSVAFRTPVRDSSGVAHVLEHTALCGSVRYPVRDPFFLLVRRSLKTFMNAMTAQDYTMYPFSTQNEKDFRNLAEVYLDAAFFPLLNEMDFKQEGHRLEVAEAKKAPAPDATATASAPTASGLEIKGVVYNEMKGAMSDTSQLFLTRLQAELFPTNSNHWNSGGEPAVIPTLTHAQLKDFHAECYNLDNAVFISYGDREPPLELVHDRVIEPTMKHRRSGKAPERRVPAPYQSEHRFAQAKVVHATCPPDPLIPDPTKQTKVSIAMLCRPPAPGVSEEEVELEQFALQMLSSLLLDSATAPLYQSLIDPNIGSGYAPGTGYDSSTKEATFGVGLQGIAEADVERVLTIIRTTLEQVAVDGFPAERIDASIHQVEIALKHVRSHFGIGVLMRLIPAWAHGTNPVLPMRMNRMIDLLRAKLQAGPYFQQLVRTHLLDNPHSVTLVMKPDADYARKETEAEATKLAAQAKLLTEADRDTLRAQAAQLITLQNAKQDTQGCQLPSLSVTDISPLIERVDVRTIEVAVPSSTKPPTPAVSPFSSALPRFVSLAQPTNGVGYIRALVSAKRVPLALRPYLPLYTSFLTELGTAGLDYRQLSHELENRTGGISADLQVFSHLGDLLRHEEFVLFKSLALQRNIPHMMSLLHSVLHTPMFGNLERLQQLLLQTAASCASSLQESGSGYATSDASQHLFSSGAAGEIYSGIKHVQFVNGLVQRLTQAEPEEAQRLLQDVASKLDMIARILMQEGLERVFIVGDDATRGALQDHLPTLMTQPSGIELPSAVASEFPFTAAATPSQSFYALPLAVNHVSMVVPTVPYTHADAPALDVMAKILSSVYVHREVREKGGAYGGHVSHSSDGVLAFSSFRDPNTLRTLDAYRAAPDWLQRDGGDNFSSVDVEEALLSLFSSIDAPKPPSAKGLGHFLFGITDDQRQAYRSRLLGVNKDAVLDVCSRYLSSSRLSAAHVSIVGDETNVPEQVRSSSAWAVQTVDLAPPQAGEELDDAEEDEEEGSPRA